MVFGTVRSVRLFQCTREVSPLSEWVKWRLFKVREQTTKRIITLRRECPKFQRWPSCALVHEASTEWEPQEGSEHHSRMWSLRHCRCVMWIRFMFHVLCFCIYMSYSHPESYRTIIACATAKSCFWFFVRSKTLFSGCRLSVFYWIFALFVCVILGNKKSLCYKYRTSIFRYVKYAYEPYGTVLPYCRTVTSLAVVY
jgi:hypothetical protein